MASRKPVELYGPRGQRLAPAGANGRGQLIDSSRFSSTYGNGNLKRLDEDHHRNIGSLGRIDLMNLGRFLYSNFGPVRFALNQMAGYASDDFTPSYVGADDNFKNRFREWLPLHDLSPDIASDASMQELRKLILVSAFRDGDVGIILTSSFGRPKFQLIPAHRIGGQYTGGGVVDGGEFDGAKIIDGVIVDPATHKPIGYRVLTGDRVTSTDYVDVSARSMRLFMASRDYIGQLRGQSLLGGSAFSWYDIAEWEKNELLAQRIASGITLIRKNEEGEADPMSDALGIEKDESCNETAFYQEFQNGEIMYISPREDVQAFIANRPTENQREFIASAIRNALAYMGFSPDFSFDTTKIGGASLRVVADQANKRIVELQKTILEPFGRWYYAYAVAKNIKNEVLPAALDYWKMKFIGSQRISADRRYDSQVDLAEMKAGVKTYAETTSVRGGDWMDVREQLDKEATDLLIRAQRLSSTFGISIQEAMTLLGDKVTAATAVSTNQSDNRDE
jgi:capsid protein